MSNQLDRDVAEALGYIRYPDDSIEHGQYWHTDPKTAPFDRTIHVDNFEPTKHWGLVGPLLAHTLEVDEQALRDEICRRFVEMMKPS